MKKTILILLATLAMAPFATAQQFSLPIMPEKMWPSDYAKYETDVLSCCNYLLTADPAFNQPKHEECASFLLRWLAGTPEVSVVIAPDLVDAQNQPLLLAYISAWTRHALEYKDDGTLVCANVAVEDMLRFYETYKNSTGKSRATEKLLKQRARGDLASFISKALGI